MQEQIIQKILGYLQATEDFVLENLPEVIQQTLKYEKISTLLSAFLMLCLFSGTVSIAFYFWKKPTLDKYGFNDMASIMGVIMPLAFAPLFFAQCCSSVDKLVKIYITPKYFLIELFMHMRS